MWSTRENYFCWPKYKNNFATILTADIVLAHKVVPAGWKMKTFVQKPMLIAIFELRHQGL